MGNPDLNGTVNPKLVRRLMEELEVDEILEIKPVGRNRYYVYYRRCEWAEDDGGCWDVESYITIDGKWIDEQIISMG